MWEDRRTGSGNENWTGGGEAQVKCEMTGELDQERGTGQEEGKILVNCERTGGLDHEMRTTTVERGT